MIQKANGIQKMSTLFLKAQQWQILPWLRHVRCASQQRRKCCESLCRCRIRNVAVLLQRFPRPCVIPTARFQSASHAGVSGLKETRERQQSCRSIKTLIAACQLSSTFVECAMKSSLKKRCCIALFLSASSVLSASTRPHKVPSGWTNSSSQRRAFQFAKPA